MDVIPGHSNFTELEKGQKALSCKSVRQRVVHNVVNLLEPMQLYYCDKCLRTSYKASFPI